MKHQFIVCLAFLALFFVLDCSAAHRQFKGLGWRIRERKWKKMQKEMQEEEERHEQEAREREAAARHNTLRTNEDFYQALFEKALTSGKLNLGKFTAQDKARLRKIIDLYNQHKLNQS